MRKITCILLIVMAMACKEKYESPVESPVTGYLVIEGVVNSGPGNTNIRLTRTTKLGNAAMIFEKAAQVKIEGENNNSFTLAEKTAGNYSADNLNLPNNQKYRLRIKTNGGKEYLSAFVEVKKNPPIDTVSWKEENGGLQLYIQTHDDQNKTQYYQWEYKETWEFRSFYRSNLKYKITPCQGQGCPTIAAVYRDPVTLSYDSTIVRCWQSDTSTSMQLGSTVKLEKDIVYLPLVYIPPKSWKLGELYTIFVKQVTWTKEGYEFLEKMKKNTEVTGSVFDAQPSELKGNFQNIKDPTEPVIGFFNICNVEQRRFWIIKTDVPAWGYRPECPELNVLNISDTIYAYASGMLPTVPTEYGINGSILMFGAAPPDCVDCTLKGTNIKPSFWPQ
jgi:hypothetical protein